MQGDRGERIRRVERIMREGERSKGECGRGCQKELRTKNETVLARPGDGRREGKR